MLRNDKLILVLIFIFAVLPSYLWALTVELTVSTNSYEYVHYVEGNKYKSIIVRGPQAVGKPLKELKKSPVGYIAIADKNGFKKDCKDFVSKVFEKGKKSMWLLSDSIEGNFHFIDIVIVLDGETYILSTTTNNLEIMSLVFGLMDKNDMNGSKVFRTIQMEKKNFWNGWNLEKKVFLDVTEKLPVVK